MFAASQRHGRWGTAIEVPGLAALNKGGNAGVISVSCASAGNCAAGGLYTNQAGNPQGFVAAERTGRWGNAVEVPGLAALDTDGYSGVSSVSCGAAGNCAAGGYYQDRHGLQQGFVAAERNGHWGRAVEVPGLAALGGDAQVNSVSCAPAGNCAAGGDNTDASGNSHGFVASKQHGRWGKAIEVPGLATLNTGGYAQVWSVSCAPAGSCAAGGYYSEPHSEQGFVAAERNGRWGTAIKVPGLAALNKGREAQVDLVSCGSAGNCAAGGYYSYGQIGRRGFVASERNGRWGTAVEVPGLAALDTDGYSGVTSVSCASAGSCAVGGYYTFHGGEQGAFVASERNGRWAKAIKVPGLAALSKGGDVGVSEVSCPPAGNCAAGGGYTDRRGHGQGFVVSQTG